MITVNSNDDKYLWSAYHMPSAIQNTLYVLTYNLVRLVILL